jgi:hypothetical protein
VGLPGVFPYISISFLSDCTLHLLYTRCMLGDGMYVLCFMHELNLTLTARAMMHFESNYGPCFEG